MGDNRDEEFVGDAGEEVLAGGFGGQVVLDVVEVGWGAGVEDEGEEVGAEGLGCWGTEKGEEGSERWRDGGGG